MTNLERVEAMAGRAYGLHDADRDALLELLKDYLLRGKQLARIREAMALCARLIQEAD